MVKLHRWWCHFWVRHRWARFDFAKRYCERCGREQWLMTRPYTVADEPAATWQDMGFRATRPALAQEGGRDDD